MNYFIKIKILQIVLLIFIYRNTVIPTKQISSTDCVGAESQNKNYTFLQSVIFTSKKFEEVSQKIFFPINIRRNSGCLDPIENCVLPGKRGKMSTFSGISCRTLMKIYILMKV